MRRATCRSLGPTRSSSVTARLVIHQYDLELDVGQQAVPTWPYALWDQQVEASILEAAWQLAIVGHGCQKRFRALGCGAAGAYLTAVRRFHWTTLDFHTILTRDCTQIDLLGMAPRTAG